MRGFRDLPREVSALVIVGFTVALGFGVVAPAIPLFAREFGVGRTAAGAVISAFAFLRLITAPLAGRMVNVLGERVMVASGIAVVAVSSFLAGLAQTYWQLLLLRGVGGVGSILFSVGSASLLVRVTPSHMRGRAQGAWAGAFLLGSIAGPAVGTVASWSLRAPFFLYAGTLAVAGSLGLATLRHSELAARPAVGTRGALGLATALRNPAYRAALAASFTGDFAFVGARSAIVPQFVRDRLHLGANWVYGAFLLGSVASGLLLMRFGRLADTRGRRPVIAGGLAVGALGFVVLTVLPSSGGLMAAMVLLGVAGAADAVAPGAMMGDIVAGRGGSVVAAFQMAGDLGVVLGPLAAGWITDASSYTTTYLVAAASCLVPMLWLARSPETLTTAPVAVAPARDTSDRPR